MANRREIVKRRQAVRNIRKITRTMQLIATARYQSAYKRASATKPYSEKLAQMVGNLTRASAGIDHPLMAEPESRDRSALVVVTSARGLAGGYNGNVLGVATAHLDEQSGEGIETEVIVARQKGINYFNFVGREMAQQIPDIADMPAFGEIETIANELMERFIAGEIGSAYVAYTHFYSTTRQRPAVMQLLPLSFETESEESAEESPEAPKAVEFEFSPTPEEILGELLPSSVRMRLYQAFTEAAVSEQIARMVAMKQATDAAEEKIKQLSREYNRARQTAITMELLDIVGGASALA
jgi:F-type H+-transporting ATPase subunit gamma